MAFSDFLDEHLGERKDVGHEYRYNCPFCFPNNDFKMYVKKSNDKTDGLWHCKKCDLSGNPITFVKLYNSSNYYEALDTLSLYDYEISDFVREGKENGLTTEEILLLYMIEQNNSKGLEDIREEKTRLSPPPLPIGLSMDWLAPEARPFLEYLIAKRGFDPKDILYHNMGYVVTGHTMTDSGKYVPLNNHVIFLTHDKDGNYQYWNSRSIESKPKIKTFNAPAKDNEYSKRTSVFNLNTAIKQPDIVIVEGVPDALTIGPSGVATFGKQVTDEQVDLIVNNININQNIYIMLDADAKDLSAKLAQKIYKKHENTYIVLNDTHSDANDLGKEETWKIIKNSSVKADENGVMLLYLT